MTEPGDDSPGVLVTFRQVVGEPDHPGVRYTSGDNLEDFLIRITVFPGAIEQEQRVTGGRCQLVTISAADTFEDGTSAGDGCWIFFIWVGGAALRNDRRYLTCGKYCRASQEN